MKEIIRLQTITALLILASNLIFSQYAFGQMEMPKDSASIVQEALALIHSPEPEFENPPATTMDPKAFADLGFEQPNSFEEAFFEASDGETLFTRHFSSESNTTILLSHGVLGDSYLFNKLSGLLREATGAEVYAMDIRGHGQSGGRPGDVDYIGQYEDDLADVVTHIKKEKPDHKIIIAGHSMGGGISLRYAMRDDFPEVDGYLLTAPTLGHTNPTMRTAPADPDESKEPFLKLHIERIIGLSMLNSVGNHEFDSLNVLFFNLPENSPVTKYSHRSNVSNAPADYRDGLRAVNKPLLIIVGTEDEVMEAAKFQPVMEQYSEGELLIVEGATHNGIRHSEDAMIKIKEWAELNNLN
ncbi:alpha/beta hydrolase [Rhodohalobacter sulfatireducens]|uniref:Alpha/beta hydrolase n=1 Tax=Rhodohalobacter sulfatireducens TaxID=2911366 RepID=A0ABS9KGM1_9BACT|nr:alpha/beta hydrolase [Rhodohalobacter sulfatireducens]MCG2589999.1 alpha/beta hydrolase [Rhodohalobacter sulfatireducens]